MTHSDHLYRSPMHHSRWAAFFYLLLLKPQYLDEAHNDAEPCRVPRVRENSPPRPTHIRHLILSRQNWRRQQQGILRELAAQPLHEAFPSVGPRDDHQNNGAPWQPGDSAPNRPRFGNVCPHARVSTDQHRNRGVSSRKLGPTAS